MPPHAHQDPVVTGFERLGRWSARRRFWIVGAWAILLLAAAPLAAQTSDALRSGGFIRGDLESARAKRALHDEIGVPEAAVAVVFHSPTLRAGGPAFEAAGAPGRKVQSSRNQYLVGLPSGCGYRSQRLCWLWRAA